MKIVQEVPLAEEKTGGSTEVILFLRLEPDSVKIEARIPGAKIEEVIQKIQDLLNKSKLH